jgi:putative ABC transport system ATP-binding protein
MTPDPTPAPILHVENLSHRYGTAAVVEVAAWTVQAGEPWLLLGASGSGKTTLLHCLAGILLPTEGSVRIAGTEWRTLGDAARDRFRGQHVGLLPQRLHLVDCLSVLDNLLLAQYAAGLPRDAAAARAVLEPLGLADRLHERPHRLSFGQQQRVALARALVNRPRLVLADEPTSNLDDASCAAALGLLLEQARRSGAALVIATHDRRIKDHVPRRLELTDGKAVPA